jgi:hypothetical protein
MSVTYKRTIPLIITILCMIIVFLDYFTSISIINNSSLELQNWAILLTAFATGVGVVTAIRHHGMKIIRKEEQWWLNAWLLAMMTIFLILGIGFGQDNYYFDWLYQHVYSALSSTTYSILAFFIVSAAFRAFRARNLDAAILLVSGFLVIIGNTPASPTIWNQFPVLRDWLMNIPVAAVGRVVVIGGGLGMITLALRLIIGKEVVHLGGAEGGEA